MDNDRKAVITLGLLKYFVSQIDLENFEPKVKEIAEATGIPEKEVAEFVWELLGKKFQDVRKEMAQRRTRVRLP